MVSQSHNSRKFSAQRQESFVKTGGNVAVYVDEYA